VTRRPIELVCFDLGGVLVRVAAVIRASCRRADLPEIDEQSFAAAWEQMRPTFHDFERGRITFQHYLHTAADHLRPWRTDQIGRLMEVWLEGVYDGVDRLLGDLSARGVATACLSNTNECHWSIMFSDPAYAPLARLTHRLASHLAGCRKPEAAIYEHLEQRLGIAPDAVIFFDDLADNIAAAETRGWQTMLVDSPDDPITQIRRRLRDAGVLRE
jgi:putative hydrolase of the HAD superfamily